VNEEQMDREGRKPKPVIVGGSIAGISSAHALTLAGWDVIVLEKPSHLQLEIPLVQVLLSINHSLLDLTSSTHTKHHCATNL